MPTLHVRPEPLQFVRQSSPPTRSAAKGAETPKRRRIAIDPDTETEKQKQQDPQLLRALMMDATPSNEPADSSTKLHKRESHSKEQSPRLLRAPTLDGNPINTSILHELVPLRLFERTKKPEGKGTTALPQWIILILYAGRQDSTCTAAAIQEIAPWLTPHVFEVDYIRCEKTQDMLATEPYRSLKEAASEGRVLAVIGGPNCRTWSIRLHMPKPGGGIPLRGRDGPEVWGLLSNSSADQKEVDDDSILLLRMWSIFEDASIANSVKPAFLFEHPTDPATCNQLPAAKICSSIWVTDLAQKMFNHYGIRTKTFDQCRLGQIVAKTTTIGIDEGLDIANWPALKCDHPGRHRNVTCNSQDLSRWAGG